MPARPAVDPVFTLNRNTGAVLWVTSFTLAGYAFGNLESVRRNFQYVIIAIIAISVMPMVVEMWRARRRAQVVAGSPR